MKSNPLLLDGKKLHAATNIQFDEGVVRTRPGFRYTQTGVTGQFQGACFFQPKRGISSATLSSSDDALILAVGGQLWSGDEEISGNIFRGKGDVNLFQAENYLIAQNPQCDTFWWDCSILTRSPGMVEVTWEEIETPINETE